MKRIGLFFYYLWVLLWPNQDVFIWSPALALRQAQDAAWKLAGIAASWPSVPQGEAKRS